MSLPTVQVLLATYNGERFLREQIDSVLAQRNVDVRVLAHDDASSDATLDILHDYAARLPQQVHVLEDGVRCGSAKENFKHLLTASTAQYVAFCDQDDVWLPDKLSLQMSAMQSLEGQHGATLPLLVYTDARVVDEALNVVSPSLWATNALPHATSPTFAQLLAENVVTGCTALLNSPLTTRMRAMPRDAEMHDHWAALLASALGAMQAVPHATVLYRQHSANVVGAAPAHAGPAAKLLRWIGSEGVQARARQLALDRAQAASLLDLYGDDLPAEHRDTIRVFLDLPRQSRLQHLRSLSRSGLWRADLQRLLAQVLDVLQQPPHA